MALNRTGARLAYGLLFCGVLPAVLAVWAIRAAPLIGLPPPWHRDLGLWMCAAGLLLWAAGAVALWRKGGGLPMNAFPPPRLVTSGVYRLIPHPIYCGFCLLWFGVSVAARSSAGLWLVSPVLALGCASLVFGYERPELERRFGPEALKQLQRLPAPMEQPPDGLDFLRFHLLVSLPWAAVYQAGVSLGVPGSAVNTALISGSLPARWCMDALYLSLYAAAMLAPLLIRSKRRLRTLGVRLWVSLAMVLPLHFLLPAHAPWSPFTARGAPGRMPFLERALDVPGHAWPSFHAIWAVLIAAAGGGWGYGAWAGLTTLAGVAAGMHSVLHVLAGAALALFAIRSPAVWEWLRAAAERIANSWREWRIGPVRIINHGLYAGAGTFVCLLIVGSLAGDGSGAVVLLTAAAGLAGAGLWAQWVEGSPRLLRPFGFYGGLFAVMAASLAAPWFGADPWRIMAAYCVAGPWLQSIGRLRCLVQGCCHGRPASPAAGVRYVHPRSRVCRLAGLSGVPLHPTPLYSILWNMLIALLLARLWATESSLALIGGLYLILTGIGRFCEEGYRGEPQTPEFAGLRLYQWISIATVLGGIAITSLVRSGPATPAEFRWSTLAIAAAMGLVAAIALGVDFPESDRRFARLT